MKIKSVHISEIHMNLCLFGYFCQVHPLGLCNTSEDGDLYEYGWVGVVRLTPPDDLNEPCFTLVEKVWYTSILELPTVVLDTCISAAIYILLLAKSNPQ